VSLRQERISLQSGPAVEKGCSASTVNVGGKDRNSNGSIWCHR